MADDCLRLFERVESEDFSKTKQERWYERLWSAMVSGAPRRQAEDCQDRGEAQEAVEGEDHPFAGGGALEGRREAGAG